MAWRGWQGGGRPVWDRNDVPVRQQRSALPGRVYGLRGHAGKGRNPVFSDISAYAGMRAGRAGAVKWVAIFIDIDSPGHPAQYSAPHFILRLFSHLLTALIRQMSRISR